MGFTGALHVGYTHTHTSCPLPSGMTSTRITLTNINSSVRLSSSSHALQLLALIPVPKFVGVQKKIHGILENRLIHACLDFVTSPLKTVAQTGTWMGNYTGYVHYCFPLLVAYIADTPEAGALTGVVGKTSHLTRATFKEFGDPFRHLHEWPATFSHPSVASPTTSTHPMFVSMQPRLGNSIISMVSTSPSGVTGCCPTEPSQTHHKSSQLKSSTTSTSRSGTTT